MKITNKMMEEIAVFVGEVIENGYNVEKSLNHLQKEHKLNDIQISNIEELIVNFNHEYTGNEEEWDSFQDAVVDALDKRI